MVKAENALNSKPPNGVQSKGGAMEELNAVEMLEKYFRENEHLKILIVLQQRKIDELETRLAEYNKQ